MNHMLEGRGTYQDEKRLVLESGLFDVKRYANSYSVNTSSIHEAVEHYLTRGWKLGFDPSLKFSTSYYLKANHDVSCAGINPLIHYLRDGKAEGRLPLPPFEPLPVAVASVKIPSDAEWALLDRFWRASSEPIVDVIVPVYAGRDETLRCLYSVLMAPQKTPYRLVVVNDHSPDIELRVAIEKLAARSWIELYETPTNQGFVAACNLGMRLHCDRDVVLLNSDTEVHNDWLDRLRDAALRSRRTATVTPLSNNAEICSYPHICRNNQSALKICDNELDALAAAVNAGKEIEIPTGVGFCMYVRRACIDEIGLFDLENFGFGYGEENDFCRCALRAGWRSILAPNIFVRHYGGTSFGESKLARVRKAIETVEARHPGYLAEVGEFIRADPVQPCREALDIARLAHRAKRKGAILFVNHDRGGGTERHAQDLAGLLEENGYAVFFCRPVRHSQCVQIVDPIATDIPNLPEFNLTSDLGSFILFLQKIAVTHIHVHHLADFHEKMGDFLRVAAQQAKIPYDVTIHDYMPVCPRINFIDWSGIYCGEPPQQVCETCIRKIGSPFGSPVVWEWRDRFARLFRDARRIFVPDLDVARRMQRYMPGLTFQVRVHLEPIVLKRSSRKTGGGSGDRTNRTIVVIGAIGPHKGVELLLKCARIALDSAPGLEFTVLGYTDRDCEFRELANVSIAGRYAEADLHSRLIDLNADVAWFPAVWPETYSYTLSAALAAGILPAAFDFGAISSRLRTLGWGELMPLKFMLHPDQIVERLATMPLREFPAGGLPPPPCYDNPLESYYGL
jgi:GT2 family glycosyltransferase/glycosyltransferase involved in cell wall biosynthesis